MENYLKKKFRHEKFATNPISGLNMDICRWIFDENLCAEISMRLFPCLNFHEQMETGLGFFPAE